MTGIIVLDGAGCIGGNKILLQDGDVRLFFDFGRNFSTTSRYYEEFLNPKTCQGIYEPVVMGLLPPYQDLYRPDLVSEQFKRHRLWEAVDARSIGDIGGVLVSHAHVDHIGDIHYLRTDIPIYCSPLTAAIARALQDISPGGGEYCYYNERSSAADEYVMGLTKPNDSPAHLRTYHLTCSPRDEFVQMWNSLSQKKKELAGYREFHEADSCAGLLIRSFPVDHSVYGATAWAVETSAGWVVYTGDIRTGGKYGKLTQQFAEEVSKLSPVALIIEGTRVDSKTLATEDQVYDSCLEAVRNHSGLVVADFGPRNVERLLMILRVARETGRELAVLPADAYLLDLMRKAADDLVPSLDSFGIKIYWEYQVGKCAWKQNLRDKYPESLFVDPDLVRDNQGSFICCFSFWDINELAYIKPVADSAYIFSSCEAFNEEMKIDAQRLRAWIERFELNLYGRLDESDQESDPFHVSGHAPGPELKSIVETVRPKKLIPVHCEKPECYRDLVGDLCEVIIPEVGVPIEL
ncbi:MAG: MBL fold metallo-hydrolase [Armatimonadota bacterium]